MQKRLRKFVWNYLLVSFIFVLIFSRISVAQPVGSPLATQSQHGLTLSLHGGYFSKDIFGVRNTSPRFLIKGIYGLAGLVDFYGTVGFVKLRLEMPGAGFEFTDKYRLGYGAGMNLRIFDFEQIRLSSYVSGQIFRFEAKPTGNEALNVAVAQGLKVTELDYDWRELNFNYILAKGFANVTFYTGVNGKIIERHETRTDKIVFNATTVSADIQSGKYKSGLIISPLLGMDFNFPGQVKLSVEGMATSESDFAFYVGLSQTGSP